MRRMARRVYECCDCHQQVVITTNHEGDCWPTCKGKCKDILNPHTSREAVLRKQTTHRFVEPFDGKPRPGLILVD